MILLIGKLRYLIEKLIQLFDLQSNFVGIKCFSKKKDEEVKINLKICKLTVYLTSLVAKGSKGIKIYPKPSAEVVE